MSKSQVPMILLIFGLFAVPVLTTLNYTSTDTNFLGACLMLAVAAAAWLKLTSQPQQRIYRISRFQYGFAIAMALVIVGWMIQGIPFWSIQKSMTYLAALILYLTFCRALQDDHELLRQLVSIKLLVLSAVSVFFILFIYSSAIESASELKESPPVFTHLRHLNYELYFGVILASYSLLSGRKNLLIAVLMSMLVFLTIWSGGRGSMLAITAALIYLIVFSRHLPVWRLMAILAALAIIMMVIIFSSEKQYLLINTIEYSVTTKPQQFTAGRTIIWLDTINTVLAKGPAAILTGLGPDAFREYQISPGRVHTHNLLSQAFIEFGLIGLAVLTAILARFAILSIRLCKNSREPAHHLAAALFFGGVVFSMFDGIFHHIAPLVMMVLTMAFLQSASASLAKKPAIDSS
ncbi:O-antigen ligase family protein [Pseudomonadota bacterium]